MYIIIYYVLPNLMLFGGIYLITKAIDRLTEDVINNYDRYQQILLNFTGKVK